MNQEATEGKRRPMKITMRPYQDEEDFWRIRAFLRQVLILNDLREKSWHVARLDYWRWHVIDNCHDCGPVESVTFLWETQDGQIAAVLNPEPMGDAFLQLHPALCTPSLQQEMLAVAEQHLAKGEPDGRRSLRVYANADDPVFQEFLARQGYTKTSDTEYMHRRMLSDPLPKAPLPEGFTVRSLGDVDELPARSWLSWKGFHADEPDENYEGWQWYLNVQRCPLYRRDLDLVVAAPNGELAAYCTIWYDDVTRSAYYEPVATHPHYHRRGLGKAVMSEGLRRLQRMGALAAFVSGYSTAANALYTSIAPDCTLSEAWLRNW
jgi:mycothiol synthase